MTRSGDGIYARRALYDRKEIERAAVIVNTDRKGRRRPGMGTVTQYTLYGAAADTAPVMNVPEWCAYSRKYIQDNPNPAPLASCCAPMFCDTSVDPFSAAIDMGRPDLDKIHSCARYTE